MPYEPPEPRATSGRVRLQRLLNLTLAAMLVAAVTYFGYVGFEGSRLATAHGSPSRDCRTPAALGLEYEAINYDIAADAHLAAEPDPKHCTALGPVAGRLVRAADGTGIAGWWIPSAADIGPAGPTVVLAHGWGSNKSRMLDHVALLHPHYNVVAFDFRNHGQSAPALTTQGVLEQTDLRAILDWLERSKAPERIALYGVSMGGATAANVADDDERVDALILDSTHATLVGAFEVRAARAGYPLALPVALAVLFGSLVRTGLDLSAVDPVLAVDDLGHRPLLILHGTRDASTARSSPEELLAAAREAGVESELHLCDADHAALLISCGDDYSRWVLGFLARTLGTG